MKILKRYVFFDALVASVAAIVIIIVAHGLLGSRWETNDDVEMSMMAHGYGLASYGTSNLIFSNSIWGKLVRLMPSFFHIVGYSWAMLTVLFLSLCSCIYFLKKSGLPFFCSIIVCSILFLRAIVFPQFTIIAGLATLAGVLAVVDYSRKQNVWVLIWGYTILLLGFLLRSGEFFFLMLVALPVLPFKKLLQSKAMIVTSLFLIATLFSIAANHYSSRSEDWKDFHEFQSARVPYNDYGLSKYVLSKPDVLKEFHMSQNDLLLIGNWFFADPEVNNPARLQNMAKSINRNEVFLQNFQSGLKVFIKRATNELGLLIFLSAASFFLALGSRKVFISWIIFLIVVCGLCCLGRAGVIRVYTPVLSLLVVAPFIKVQSLSKKYIWALCILLIFSILLQIRSLLPEITVSNTMIVEARTDAKQLSQRSISVWGGTFPTEYIYLPFSANDEFMDLRLDLLDVFYLSPNSVSAQNHKHNQDFVARLEGEPGVDVVLNDYQEDLLRTYCKEHIDADLRVLKTTEFTVYKLKTLNCAR